MRLEKQVPITSRLGIQHALIVTIVYSIGIYAMKFWQPTDSFELRLAAFIPVALGLLWGAPAAIGSCIANIICTLLYGSDFIVALVAGIGNFYLAYLPYRLWYAVSPRKASLYIYDSRTFSKFIMILLVVAFDFAAIITTLIRWQYGVSPSENFFITFSNNFDIPIVFGIPLLVFMCSHMDKVYCNFAKDDIVIVNETADDIKLNSFTKHLVILGMLTMLNVCMLIISHMTDLGDITSFALMLLNLVVMGYCCTIESRYQPIELEKNNFHSIGAEMTMKLLLGTAVLITFGMANEVDYSIQRGDEWDNPAIWMEMYQELTIMLNIAFVGVYIFLLQTEKQVIKRLEQLSTKVKDYATNEQIEADVTELEYIIANAQEENELDVLEKSFGKMRIDISKYMSDLTRAITEKQSIESQLSIAAEIQQGVLPKLGDINKKLREYGYEVKADMTAAKTVGGDMYDCFFIDDDHFAIMIADVSGKGIPASLFMMTTQAMIKNNAPLTDPGFIIEKSNDTLARNNDRMLFVTMWLGVLQISTGKMTYANAGHNPPLIMSEGKVEWIKKRSGPVLGIMPETPYKDREIMIPSGGKLLLYTDGVNEAENATQELFGNERLEESFAKNGDVADVLKAVKEFVGGATQSDDMTYLWLERK